MKFVVDMNLSPKWVAELSGQGWETKHWATVGASTAADIRIIGYARNNDCIVLTQDLDFGTILSASGPGCVKTLLEIFKPAKIGRRPAQPPLFERIFALPALKSTQGPR